MFTFKARVDILQSQEPLKLTKRKILSQVARIYDPIEFATAFLIRAKVGLQELWQMGVDWDEELPPKIQTKWMEIFKEMKELNGVSFPRGLFAADIMGLPTLCVFADASEDAFGACAYLRWRNKDGTIEVKFVVAKSRVAPLKKLTIPRLELQSSLLASRMSKTIQNESRLQLEETIYFTDSTIALAWIQSTARGFKQFVSARVGEIQSNTDPKQWRHIPSEANVADEVSRGIPVRDLNGRWQRGPQFLHLPKEEWPEDKPAPDEKEVKKEARNIICTVKSPQQAIESKKFSDWRKLIRVTSYVLRFLWRIRGKRRTSNGNGQDRTQQNHEALWGCLYMSKHESSPPRIGRRLFHHGFSTSVA